jgi:hypothetical protein
MLDKRRTRRMNKTLGSLGEYYDDPYATAYDDPYYTTNEVSIFSDPNYVYTETQSAPVTSFDPAVIGQIINYAGQAYRYFAERDELNRVVYTPRPVGPAMQVNLQQYIKPALIAGVAYLLLTGK